MTRSFALPALEALAFTLMIVLMAWTG